MDKQLKICCTCKASKPRSDFQRCASRLDGLQKRCRVCQNDISAQSYLRNRIQKLASQASYRAQNPDRIKATRFKSRKARIEKIKAYQKSYFQRIKAKRNEWFREYLKRPEVRIKRTIQSRVRNLLGNNGRSGRTLKLLGVSSAAELRQYLTKLFKPGMSWDNYGFFGWHIDHIKPLSSFNLENERDLSEAFHYSNLQPLWWRENLSKGKRS